MSERGTLPGPGDPGGEPDDDEASYVRPYTVTGGRTRPTSASLPIEALVETVCRPGAVPGTGLSPEKRQILALTDGQYLSVAEISAHLHLPVGVVRVLVSDLADEELVRVHGIAMTDAYAPATALSVLESVLNGISAL